MEAILDDHLNISLGGQLQHNTTKGVQRGKMTIGSNGHQRRIAIYARVSTADQNCKRQILELEEYAQNAKFKIVGKFTEKASGAKNNRKERAKVIKLAQGRKIDAVLVTELTRWGRSTTDLISTLENLESWGVSIIATTGLTFDLSTAQGKLMANIMAALAEFERDLVRERVKSGLAAAKANGTLLGRKPGQDFKVEKIRKRALNLSSKGFSNRAIARQLKCSPTTVKKALQTSSEQ